MKIYKKKSFQVSEAYSILLNLLVSVKDESGGLSYASLLVRK